MTAENFQSDLESFLVTCKEGIGYRVVGGLKNTDVVMENAFGVGMYPGMTEVRQE